MISFNNCLIGPFNDSPIFKGLLKSDKKTDLKPYLGTSKILFDSRKPTDEEAKELHKRVLM